MSKFAGDRPAFSSELIRCVKTLDTEGIKPTHASAFLVWYSAPTKDVKRAVELGSGNGVVSLALARLYGLYVEGIELQQQLFEASQKAIELNDLQGRVAFHHLDVRDVRYRFQPESFDMVVANVPFHRGKASPLEERRVGRSATLELIDSFVEATAFLLRNRGTFVYVCGQELSIYLIERLTRRKLVPQRMALFIPKPGGPVRLVALRGKKNGGYGLVIELVEERVQDKTDESEKNAEGAGREKDG